MFSHSTRVLDLLEKFVQRVGYDYVRLDGSTAQKQRQPLVDEFNTRPSIFLFLMSTVAGGVGLNLTAANKVVSAEIEGELWRLWGTQGVLWLRI